MKPGLAISSKDFRNPWTPGNTAGSKDAAINVARLVDVAPKMSTIYTDSGNTITQVYKQILDGVHIPAQPPNPAVAKQLADADAYLFRMVDVTDPETGAVSQKKVESQVYRDYIDNQTAYNNARSPTSAPIWRRRRPRPAGTPGRCWPRPCRSRSSRPTTVGGGRRQQGRAEPRDQDDIDHKMRCNWPGSRRRTCSRGMA